MSSSPPPDKSLDAAVVQIGRGPTGTALARHLLPQLAAGTRYVVVDRDPTASHLAFGTPEPTHLINTRAAKSSLNPADPDECLRWTTAHAEAAGVPVPEFPARRWYGHYVADMFDQAVRQARAAGVIVDVVRDDAVRVLPLADGRHRVECAGGFAAEADRVALCPGMQAQADPVPAIAGAAGYFGDPWRLPELPREARIAIVGTRLTAIDTFLTLAARGPRGPIVLASRSGRLPRLRGSEAVAPVPHVEACMAAAYAAGTLRLEDFGRALMADIEAASTTPPDWREVRDCGPTTRTMLAAEIAEVASGVERGWQQVINGASPVLLPAWQLLAEEDRAVFFTEWLTPLLVHGAPIPLSTARRVLAGIDAGQLHVAGGLSAVRQAGEHFLVRTAEGEIEADVVINATGAATDEATLRREPLLAHLLDQGSLTAHPHGGVRIDVATFEAVDRAGAPVRGLHVIGDLTRGAVLVTNDVLALSFLATLAANAMSARREAGVPIP